MAKKFILPTLWLVVIVYVLCLDLKGVWTDEGNRYGLLSGGQTWQQFNRSGQFGSFGDVVTAVGPTFYQPLFYLVDNAIIRAARSRSDVLLRLVNILWLLAALQGLLRFFRDYSDYTRIFGILILALNGYMLMNVMQIREYPMYVALTIWSSCLFFELLESPGPPRFLQSSVRLAAYGVSMGLLFLVHAGGGFAIAAQAVMLLFRRQNRAAFLRNIAFSYAVAAAVVLPWLLTIYLRFPNKLKQGIWDRRPATMALLYDSMIVGFRHVLTYNVWAGAPLLQAFGVLILAGIPLAWIATLLRREALDRRAVYAVLTMLFFGAFQVTFFFKGQPLSIWPRYFISYFAGYVIAATCAFAALERYARKSAGVAWKAAACAVFLLAGTAGADQVQRYRADPYMDTGMSDACNWRVVTRSMIQHIRPEETIAYYYPLQAWTMSVYYPFYPHALSYGDIVGPHPPTTPSFWIFDTGVMPEYLRQVMDRLNTLHYTQTRTVDIGCQCKLFRYELGAEVPPPSK